MKRKRDKMVKPDNVIHELCGDGSLNNMSLEELLKQGISEAKELFARENLFLAGYTLFLVSGRYHSEGRETPEEVKMLQGKIDTFVNENYSSKIKKAVDERKYSDAFCYFVDLSMSYTKQKKKLPKSLFEFVKPIAAGMNDPMFVEAFVRERFDD